MYHVNRLIKGKGTNITLKDTAKYPFQKFDIFGKTEQKRVEGIEGKRITAEYITANDIQSENGRITIEGNTYQDLEPLLPEEYIQLDYIEGTGSQYINLGYGLGTNSKIELSIDIDRSVIDGKGYALFGARSNMDDGYAIWANISDNNKMRWDVKTSKTGNGALVNGNNIVIKDGFDNYLNGIKVSANTTVDDFEPKYDSYLLSINTAKTAERALPAKIKYFKAWVDGNLEWDCLPAKRVSDGAIGLYDLVYGDFLVSATSVAFAAGNEVTIPNFDNQREVKAVGDNIQLFNKNDESITYNYRLGSDGALFGQDNVARQSFVSGYISIDELNDYIVNYSVTDYSKRICFYDENKKFISANTSSSVFKTPEASKYLRLCNLISEKENIKLEKGTKSTPWSEFGQGNTTIVKRNKNFLKLEDTTFTSGDATSVISNGTITVNGTLSSSYNYITPKISNFIKAGNYVFSKNTEAHVLGVRLYNKDGTKNTYSVARGSLFKKITIKKDAEAYELYLGKPSTEEGEQAVDLQIKPQLEEGEIQTDFVPNETEKYIVPTQEPMYERDDFIKIANTWYERHNYNQVLVTGNEGWAYITDTQTWYCQSFFKDKLVGSEIKTTHYPTMLVTQSSEMTDRYMGVNSSTGNKDRLYIKDTIHAPTTLADFKVWVKNLNIKVYYKLSAVKLIECTQEQSSILDELYNTKLYTPTTNVYSTDEISPINTLRYDYVIASPSIEIPSDVRACGDNIQLFDKDNANTISSYIDNTGYFQYNTQNKILYIECEKNEDYTVSSKYLRAIAFVNEVPKSGITSTNFKIQNTTELTLNSGDNTYLTVWFWSHLSTLTEEELLDSIKICKGTSTGGYSEFGQGNMTIEKSNANLFNKNKSVAGYLAVNTGNIASATDMHTSDFIRIDSSKTYYLPKTGSARGKYFDKDKKLLYPSPTASTNYNDYGGNANNPTIIKNIPEEAKYVRYSVKNELLDTFYMVEGEKDTGYIEHQSEEYVVPTQKPLLDGDYLDLENEEQVHTWEKIVLDGTETIKLNSTKEITQVFTITVKNSTENSALSNYFKDSVPGDAEKVVAGNGVIHIAIDKTVASTVEEFKTWLSERFNSGKPVYIWYKTATETRVPFTEEQKAVAKQIKEDDNYKNVTIMYSEDEIEPNLDVAAFKKVTDLFKERLLTGKITRAYLRVLANETEPEMIINERNYLKDVKFEELRYVPDEGIVGGTVAKRVTGNFNNVDSDFSIQDREFELYMGVDMDDDALNTPSGINVYNKNAKTTNAYIDASGKLIPLDNRLYTVQDIKPKFKKYIMSYTSLKGAGNVRMSYYNENKFISREYSAVSGKIFTVPDNCNRIDIRVDCLSNIYFTDLMITGGETIPEEYEEFIPNIDYIKLGTYIVKKPENNTIADNTSFEALDYMFKLNLPWDNEITFPCTIKALFDNLVAQSGLKTNITSFPNQDFVVEANPFDDGVTRREVLSAISQMAFNWARLDQEDVLKMDFEQTDEIQEVFDIDKYSNLDTQDIYGPVNVIVLRNSQVEGENVTIKDDKSISQYGETELVIADNPFAFTEAKRAELIEAGRRLFGLTYTPMTMDMIGYLFLNCQDKIKAQALSGKEYETYLFNHTIEYNGTISDSMESPAKTKTVTKYQFTPDLIKQMRRTEIIVDKANENITLISENLSATNDKVAQLRIEKDKIEAEVNNINKEIEDANGNIVTLKSTTEKLTQTIEGLTNTLTNTGGINLIRNSVGVFDSEYWEGVVKHYTDTEIKNNTTSGHSILLQNGTITQIVNLKNGFYNISFLYKKIKELSECKIKINDFEILLEELELTNYEKVIEVTDNAVKIEMISDTDDSCYVSDLLLIAGTSKQEWTQNINETASDTVKIGKGIEITSTTSRTKLIADSESVRINNTTNNETVAEFTSTGTTTKNLIVQETAQIAGLLIQKNGNQTWISSLL